MESECTPVFCGLLWTPCQQARGLSFTWLPPVYFLVNNPALWREPPPCRSLEVPFLLPSSSMGSIPIGDGLEFGSCPVDLWFWNLTAFLPPLQDPIFSLHPPFLLFIPFPFSHCKAVCGSELSAFYGAVVVMMGPQRSGVQATSSKGGLWPRYLHFLSQNLLVFKVQIHYLNQHLLSA